MDYEKIKIIRELMEGLKETQLEILSVYKQCDTEELKVADAMLDETNGIMKELKGMLQEELTEVE